MELRYGSAFMHISEKMNNSRNVDLVDINGRTALHIGIKNRKTISYFSKVVKVFLFQLQN